MAATGNKVLSKMLDRLFAALINGPALNCRPHSSRQRFDFTHLAKLQDLSSEEAFRALLGEERCFKVTSKVAMPPRRKSSAKRVLDSHGEGEETPVEEPISPQERAAQQAWAEQQSILSKVRTIAEDARTYENDTGVHVLHVGFPLLSLPPGKSGLQRGVSRRILAPLAFVSVNLTLKAGPSPSILLECKGEGADLVVPNIALLSWLERQTGQTSSELFSDEAGEDPWKEIGAIVRRISELLQMPVPEFLNVEPDSFAALKLQAAPRADDPDARPTILPAAIVGLFPTTNQGLLRDTQTLLEGQDVAGPLESFIRRDATLIATEEVKPVEAAAAPVQLEATEITQQRLVSAADPCQTRAVKLARTAPGLVIHGPPGTGKSQTITNIIGDHLARGERVLLVCDKRTALDVVVNRLESLGLGRLCAIVHDPQRDQRELYKSIHEQLDGLTDVRSEASAEARLGETDAELERLHAELLEYHGALMFRRDGAGASFHELMGQWLSLPSQQVDFKEALLAEISPQVLEAQVRPILEVLERGITVGYPKNPWREAAGIGLGDFLATPMENVRTAADGCVSAAKAADETADAAIPAFSALPDLMVQANARAEFAGTIAQVVQDCDPAILAKWAGVEIARVRAERQKLTAVAPLMQTLRGGGLDAELSLVIRAQTPALLQINHQLAALEQYIEIASKWYGFVFFKRKSQALAAMTPYGVSLNAANAGRLKVFLDGLRARLLLQTVVGDLIQKPAGASLEGDELLSSMLSQHTALFDLLIAAHDRPELVSIVEPLRKALIDPSAVPLLFEGLKKSVARARSLTSLFQTLHSTGLFNPEWVEARAASARGNGLLGETFQSLREQVNSLEGVLRISDSLEAMPGGLASAVAPLLSESVGPEAGLMVLRKSSLALEIGRRLKQDPGLQKVDGQRLKTAFNRYRGLEQQKKTLVRDAILHRWISRQKERVLASTGSRLNSAGADLRRRLTSRGQNAMRLRQVIAVGQQVEGGDPLFDLRPVWMASPETVAQLFPRLPLFDVVVFDEASQCRLEEALPVLLRAKRVVIAGDPKQLPPTRFFESALVASEEDEIESDDQLFESQQGEIEDLLGAALNLGVEQCYLDVHYRSRNADLIQFSNQQFYNSRLQPIPGHPANRSRYAPMTVYNVGGTYDKRSNPAEADRVAQIVQDLLKRAKPPSIGIACFNLQQRDLIVERLELLAGEDGDFRQRLADARVRRGPASFEGLFIKNLENVQGDERDHMIISTTYGPDPAGRFYRRFGPLGRAGGGRRLNVLVTRAREEVHLVTSIPASVYRALPPVPPNETPGGGWLLFSYLCYAEQIAQGYEVAHAAESEPEQEVKAAVQRRVTEFPSAFSTALADTLATAHNVGSEVPWGNDGFCIDLALQHPHRAEEVTIGVMCDLTRYGRAQDPVEWEVFRSGILEGQGWKLHRLWTPQYFRDREGSTQAILQDVNEALATEQEKDAIKVVGTKDMV